MLIFPRLYNRRTSIDFGWRWISRPSKASSATSDLTMRNRLITTLLAFFFSSPLFAGNLCNAGCTLVIDFPTGGTIHAVDELTITFGTSGQIDTVGTLTAYLDSETLTLNPGDIISFDPGGSFNIGDAGNLAYTDLEISTTGTVSLEAVGGPETVNIQGRWRYSGWVQRLKYAQC